MRALPLAALGALATLALGGVEDGLEPFEGGLAWQSLVISIWEQAHAVGVIVLLLHWFGRAFDRQGALGRAAAADSYTVYIIHPLVLVILALAFRGTPLPALAKFAVIAPMALVGCFGAAHIIRPLPLLRRIL